MEGFALFAAVLYVVTSGVLGAGLLRLSRSRGGAAAGCLAWALLSASLLQALSIVAAAAGAGDVPPQGVWRLMFAALYAVTGVSASCMMRFTQIVYRPKQRLLTAIPSGVAICFAYVALRVPFRNEAPVHSLTALSIYPVLLAGYLWTAAESFRCWRDYLLPGLGVPPRLLFAALRKKSSPAIAPNLEQGKRKLARVPVDL